ncbi:thioesterase II family protein [Streptomyces sp. NPDC088387]|uniref:thioesterase II family protein n=1 Tax=Streptomyces sp. NPDC088387 TaxID=3365859 RepID=UPI003812805A
MRDDRPITLYCFAHAGAGVSAYTPWRTRTGRGVRIVPVALPGRSSRTPRPTTRAALLDALLAPLADEVADHRPYALYGHSLGGIVAHTLARALAARALPAPAFLAVGASPAPHTLTLRTTTGTGADDHVLRFVADLGAAPEGVLAAPGSLWHRTVLPVLRDDLALAAALREAALADEASAAPLTVPVLAVGGQDDPVVPAAALDGWSRWTTGRLVRRTVPGDHFFVRGPHAPRLIGRACRVARRMQFTPGLIPGGQQ